MSGCQLRKFTPADIPQINALRQAYLKVYAQATVALGESYLYPGIGSENVICAFGEDGSLNGYAGLYPRLAVAEKVPHAVWADVKVSPALASPIPLKDVLFEWVVNRSRNVTRAFPGHETRLSFQYHISETASIEYVKSKGCDYVESGFLMRCDLSRELAISPVPVNIGVRLSQMDDVTEQQAYVAARNEALPASITTLADWQYFLRTLTGRTGKVVTAYDSRQLIGSVTVYSDEAVNRQFGKAMGITDNVFIREGWRQRGIAARMIYQGHYYLKEQELSETYLEVRSTNLPALNLYKKMGYEIIAERSQLFVLKI
jgi:ribosomal protein S18 acetylase RimI-like enzyme